MHGEGMILAISTKLKNKALPPLVFVALRPFMIL